MVKILFQFVKNLLVVQRRMSMLTFSSLVISVQQDTTAPLAVLDQNPALQVKFSCTQRYVSTHLKTFSVELLFPNNISMQCVTVYLYYLQNIQFQFVSSKQIEEGYYHCRGVLKGVSGSKMEDLLVT